MDRKSYDIIRGDPSIIGSLCTTCKHRVSRLSYPTKFEEISDTEEFELVRVDDIVVEEHYCLLFNNSIDNIVLYCNSYELRDDLNKDIFGRLLKEED